jgi:hypothetical protein
MRPNIKALNNRHGPRGDLPGWLGNIHRIEFNIRVGEFPEPGDLACP